MAEYEDSAPEGRARKAIDEDLCAKLKGWFKQDVTHVSSWRKEAREDFEFYAGQQWSDEDRQKLAEQMRPALTFNRVAPLVNAVVGSEINNRREVRYLPREQGDAHANEVLTAAGEWFRDECGAEDEESEAFADTVIGGMGWTDTRLDFEDDPDGAPKIERMDCFEMVWDCNSVKPNLADAGRMFRIREMPYEEAQELFPGVEREMLNAGWAKTLLTDPKSPHDQDQADQYSGTQDDYADGDRPKKLCIIVEARWFAKEPYYRGPDYQNPQEVREYSVEEFDSIREAYPDFPGVRQTRKVVKRAFIGADILEKPDKPMVPAGSFGWECITGYFDKVTRQWYGVVRATKDPQRWSNKFFSQVMDLLNSQAKGGVIAERGAFDDDRQAEESWAKADKITYASKGALSGPAPKVIPKPVAQFPAGFFTLFQESKEAINQVTGLSPEFIGTREVEQAGVLEMQRRQSSLNLLASLFNSLRRYRKRQGRTMLYLIQEHLADGRLIRIVGGDLEQYVPLTKEAVANVRYDIIVDDSPTSPNEKDRTWGILLQLMPIVKDLITPEVALELLEISPLPASMVAKLKKKAEEAAQQPQPPTPEEQKLMFEREKHQMTMQGKQADFAMDQQRNEMDLMKEAIELMMKQREAQIDAVMDQQKLHNEAQRASVQNQIAQQRANTQRTAAAK